MPFTVNFGYHYNFDPITISSSGSSTAGETYSFMCSATLFEPIPLPSNVPSPTFEWVFNGSASLPSGVTATATVSSSNSTSETYTSILQFSPLSQSHTGMYTCQLGPGILMNSAMVTVNGIHNNYINMNHRNFHSHFPAPAISVQITTSGALILGQSGYSLTCGVTGAENLNPSISYQWTKNNGTQTQMIGTNSKTPSFSRLLPTHAGLYSCNVTVLSAYVSNVVYTSNSFEVTSKLIWSF